MEYNRLNNYLNTPRAKDSSPFRKGQQTDRLRSSVDRSPNHNYESHTSRNRTPIHNNQSKSLIRDSSPFSRLHKKIGKLQKQYQTFSQTPSNQYRNTPTRSYKSSQIKQDQVPYKRFSRQDTRKYIESMIRIVEGQIDALTERIQQFQYRVQANVQKEFYNIKKRVIDQIQQIFNSYKHSFVRELQKVTLQSNSSLFTTKQQLANLSIKLNKIRQNIEAPHWSVSVTEMDPTKISEEVEAMVNKSQKLEIHKLIFQIQTETFRIFQQSVGQILQFQGNLRSVRDR